MNVGVKFLYVPQTEMDDLLHVRRKCSVCGAEQDLTTSDTWFFVGGPSASKVLCSRECLIRFISTLPEQPPVARLKQGGCHVIIPSKR